jgi:PAS domain S-box-containing protein
MTAKAAAAASRGKGRRATLALNPALLAGFLTVTAILVAAHVIGLASLREVHEAGGAVAHSQAVRGGLEALLATLADAETGARGFVITGAPEYLEPYERARTAIAAQVASLRVLFADNVDQIADLDRLSAKADRTFEQLADAVRRRRESGFAAAQAEVADQVGRRSMDETRVIVARMEAREDALLAERTAKTATSYRSARAMRFTTSGLALLVLLALFAGTHRLGKERLRAAESAERLNVTLASIGDAVIATDAHGRVTRLNAVAEALTGWKEADAAGRPIDEVFVIISEESRQPAPNPVDRVLSQGVVAGLANHTILVARDGRETAIDDSAAPIMTGDGEIVGVVMVFRDVTERRRTDRGQAAQLERERSAHEATERARREVETAAAQLRVALETARMGTWEYTMSTGLVKWSPGLEAIHGLPPGGFPGTFDAFRNEIHPADRERVLAAVRGAAESGDDHHVEYRIVRSDGAVRWVEGRGRLFHDEGGRPERLAGVCMDVTERKHAEERFRLAIEAAPAAMIMVDGQGKIVLVNALTEQMLGYARHELLGESVDRLVPRQFRGEHAERRRGFFADRRQRAMGTGRDLFAVRSDGTEMPVEIGLSPIETEDGAFVLAAVTDITERKQAERALQEADRHKDEFLAMLAHELRNPLGAITNAAHLLKQFGPPEGNLRWARDVIDRQARHLGRIVEDLLDVSRISRGRIVLQREAMPLASAIALALDTTRPLIEARRQQFTSDVPPEPIWVDGDVTRLAQVIGNLLSNASRYTPQAGHLSLTVRQEVGEAVIRVRDRGIGIAAEMLPRVFDLFVQGERPPDWAPGGLGLGLTLARRLAEMHGGQLEAHSEGLGKGSEFVLRLPTLAGDRPVEEQVRPVTVYESVRRRILIVDDNADSAEALALALGTTGHEVRLAGDGPSALSAAAEFQPDVVLLDIGLPGMDGYEVARRLRSGSGLPHVFMVALTGYGQEADRERAREAGFDHHLVKPTSPEVILAVLGPTPRSRGSMSPPAKEHGN